MTANTQKISAVGVTPPAKLNTVNVRPETLRPGVAVALTGTMTYSIQVTGDDTDAPGWTPANANWFQLDSTSTGITTPYSAVIPFCLTAVRVNVTAYTSGTLTFSLLQ